MSTSADIQGGEWALSGACRDVDPELLFSSGSVQTRAKRICRSCPVWRQCRTEALENRIEFGLWGGLTERERRVIHAARAARAEQGAEGTGSG